MSKSKSVSPEFSVRDFFKRFPDDDACLEHVMEQRYGLKGFCPTCGVETMAKILDEARAGKRNIWHSTILYAELRPSLLKVPNPQSRYGSIEHLIDDMESVLRPIAPNVNIMIQAGKLRDFPYHRPDSVRQAGEKTRVMTVPDSIQLATCLYVKNTLKISDIEFHTFDDGKGKNYEDKAVSLLRFPEYSEHIQDLDVNDVKNLCRIKPRLSQSVML